MLFTQSQIYGLFDALNVLVLYKTVMRINYKENEFSNKPKLAAMKDTRLLWLELAKIRINTNLGLFNVSNI